MSISYFEEMIPTDEKGSIKRNIDVYTDQQTLFISISPPNIDHDIEFQLVLNEDTFLKFYEAVKNSGEALGWLKVS